MRQHFSETGAGRRLACALLTLTVVAAVPQAAAARQSLTGGLEGIDSQGVVEGWVRDSGSPSRTVTVQVFLDGAPDAGGLFIGQTTASVPRTDIPYPGAYGFRVPIPSQFRDSRPHTVSVYALMPPDTSGANLVLPGSPLPFTLDSTVVYLDNGVTRVGIEPRCGGTITAIIVAGRNLINNADCTGRQLQASVYDGNDAYDGCAGCEEAWGWNPVQGGDRWNFGSPVTDIQSDGTSAYVATRPYEWFPDNKGGGPGQPVLSDLIVEQWIDFVPNHPGAVRIRYRLTHFGSDTHANSAQEIPALYVNREYDRLVHYAGQDPWTGAPVTTAVLPLLGEPLTERYVPERWAALVDATGFGLTLYVPHQYPYVTGFQVPGTAGEHGNGANYLLAHVPLTILPNSTFEGDVFAIAGSYDDARQVVDDLRDAYGNGDTVPPFGALDAPGPGAVLSGVVPVQGWLLDNVGVARVDVLVDGVAAGVATHGTPRPDVATVWPSAPTNVGFAAAWDTTRTANGEHRVTIRATDEAGNVALLRDVQLTVDNPAPPPDSVAPTVAITGISKKGRRVTVSVSASDAAGVVETSLLVDGVVVGSNASAPYVFTLSSRSLPDGAVLVARAADAAGNVATSAPVTYAAGGR